MSQPIAVITGSSSGIGAACVHEFAAAGFWTIGIDVEPGSDADEHLVIDLASPDCGREVADVVGDRGVSVLINNAAVPGDGLLLEADTETWESTMAVNLRAPFLVSRALYPALASEGGGAIVNIASVHALASSPGAGIYATAKGGLVALTRAMALEWAPSVRVNSVLPGAVDTEMLARGLARSGQSADDLATRSALGRIADPMEIARLVRAIVLDGTFMTGASLVVDGGALARLSTE